MERAETRARAAAHTLSVFDKKESVEVIDAPVLTSTMEGVVFVVCQLAVSQKLQFISRSLRPQL